MKSKKGSGVLGRRYAKIATEDKGSAEKSDSTMHAVELGYSEEELKAVPAEAVVSLGCGTPVNRARLRPGEIVLDLGSGAGLDAFLAARRVGSTGRVIGVDVTREMVERANETAKEANAANVAFKQAEIEHLPLRDCSIDVAISNCVMNHCVDKVRAFKEVYRVLKTGGRMCISDLVASGPFSEATMSDELWGEWLKLAQSKNDNLRAIEQAGFQEVVVEEEAAFPLAEKDPRLKVRIISIGLTAWKR